jgi:uncharacterized protein (TIRG00374 family)
MSAQAKQRGRGWLLLAIQVVVSVVLMVYVCRQIQLKDLVELAPGIDIAGATVVEGHVRNPAADPLVIETSSGVVSVARHQIRARDKVITGVKLGFLTIIRRVDTSYLVWAFLALIGGYLVSVIRWWLLLRSQGIIVGFWQTLRWTYLGVFFNNVMPGSTGGDVIKAVYVARECRDRTRAVVSVFVDRLIGMSSLALLAAMMATARLGAQEFREAAIFIYSALFLLAGGLIFFFSRRIRRLLRVEALLSRLPLEGLLRQIDQAVLIYRNHLRMVMIAVGLSLFGHSLLVMSTMFIGYALGIHESPITYFIFVPVILILMAVPIAVQGWGVSETIFQQAFAKVGVPVEQALALSLANRLAVMIFSIGGGFMLLRRGAPIATTFDEDVAIDHVHPTTDVQPALRATAIGSSGGD